jgi:hypothetical protein
MTAAVLSRPQTRHRGPITALHITGLLITAIAAVAALAAILLPAIRNTALADR